MGCIIKSYRKSIIRLFFSTVAISLIFSFYYSSYVIVDSYIKNISSNITITAVMNENISEDSLRLTLNGINSFYWVKEANLIRPDIGLSKFDNNIGRISTDLLPENPLPILINVSIKDKYLNSFNLAKYNLLIKRIETIDNTILRKDYSETVFSVKNQFEILSIIIGILLGLIILLNIFLSLNPEFIKSKTTVIFSAGIKNYPQTAKEIFSLLTLAVSGSIFIASGMLYLLWYLVKEELQWYMNAPWQIMLWNLSFVLIAFEFVFLILYFIYKPKKLDKTEELDSSSTLRMTESITNYELRITNEALPNDTNKNEDDDTSTTVIVKDGDGDSSTTLRMTEEANNTIESWEDDIT